MTTPYFFVEEHKILTILFEEGLEILHLRKPNTEPVYSERLLSLIPEQYRKRIVVHDHFYLKNEYNLKGIHLNSRNPEIPANYKGHISCSCHSVEEVVKHKRMFNYVFLSPIYDSISKNGYTSKFTEEELKRLSLEKIIDKKVMALGGVDLCHVAQLKELGFGGIVLMGAIWDRFDVRTTQNFKELVNLFRKIKKATE